MAVPKRTGERRSAKVASVRLQLSLVQERWSLALPFRRVLRTALPLPTRYDALLGFGVDVSFPFGDQRAEFAYPIAMLLREVMPLTRIRAEIEEKVLSAIVNVFPVTASYRTLRHRWRGGCTRRRSGGVTTARSVP